MFAGRRAQSVAAAGLLLWAAVLIADVRHLKQSGQLSSKSAEQQETQVRRSSACAAASLTPVRPR